jgi:HEAT repeat protein
MKKTRILLIAVVAVAGLVWQARSGAAVGFDSTPLYPEPPDYKKGEAQLIETLRSGEPAKKAVACKQLAIHGTKQAVPELAKLLGDKQLSSWARIALEAIPDPSADEALRKACDSLKGELLVGTINSIGVRRDANAVEVLIPRLKDQDAEVASAAAVALGHIGNDAATKALRAELKSAPANVRSAVAEGCVYCAERLAADGKAAEAAALYDEVRAADVPKQRKLEATRGSIVSRGAAGVPLLVEQLKSQDKAMFLLGLQTTRELKGADIGNALANELSRLPADKSALLIIALGDRPDAALSDAIMNAARQGDKQVRVAAVHLIGRLGGARQLQDLVSLAADSNDEIAQAAGAAIEGLRGEDVNQEIIRLAESTHGKQLQALIEAIGARRIPALQVLILSSGDDEAAVRQSALTALGETVRFEELPILLGVATDPVHPEDADAAMKALKAACIRMPDREACGLMLGEAAKKASVDTQAQLIDIMAAVGGNQSLDAMRNLVLAGDDRLKDAGTRLLGEWMTADAAPVLLEVAKDPSSAKYQVRALRGYLRLARQFPMSDAERAEMCAKALEAAKRPEERKLVLDVLARYPSEQTLDIALKTTRDPALKQDAARTVMAIAQARDLDGPEIQELLAKIGLDPVKVEIVKAEYGAGNTHRDVTETLRKRLRDLPLITLPKASYNKSFGGDPAPGAKKQLTVQYKIDGKEGEATFAENEAIMLPMPK